MDLKRRLAEHWASEVARTPITDLGEIMDRGDTLRKRRSIAAGAVPTLGVVVVVAVFFAFQGDPPAGPEADSVAAENAVLNLENRSLDWSVVPATLGWSIERATSDGVTYVLSTAPGTRFEEFPDGNVPKAIYASTDGQDWSVHPVEGSWVSSIAASDGLLYAVGTAPGAAADSVTLQIGVSSDQGTSFDLVPLPFEEDRPATYSTHVAATGGGILALVEARISLDPFALLPPEAMNGAVEPVSTEQGLAVFPVAMVETAYNTCFGSDGSDCQELIDSQATYFATWDELGIDPDDVFSGEISHRAAYWSPDGRQYEEIDHPLPEGWIAQVSPVGEESVIAIDTPTGTSLYASANGRDWREVGDGLDLGFITAVGAVGDQVVMVGQSSDGSDVSLMRAPGLDGPWEEIALGEVMPEIREAAFTWISSATVADSGVALVLQIESRQAGAGNAISQLIGRLFGPEGAEEMRAGEETTVLQALLVTDNLVDWSLVPAQEAGGFIDHMWFQPDGTLMAHANGSQGNRSVRWQATATP